MMISAAVAIGVLSSCVPPSGNWASPHSAPSSASTPSAYDDEEQEPPAPGNSGGAYTCSAEATVATSANDPDGPWLDRQISIMGQGNTRDEAYDEAFSSCGSLVTTTLAIGETGSGYAEIRSTCRVTDCTRW